MPGYGSRERAEILDGEQDAAGVDGLGLVWRDKIGHVVLRRDGRLVAHAGWLPIELSVGGRTAAAVGLGGVLIHRSFRGQGLGATVVEAAMDRMRQLGRPIGLLFCTDARVRFYERLGWRALRSEVTVDQPEGPVTMPMRTCWIPLSAEAPPFSGPLALAGLPF